MEKSEFSYGKWLQIRLIRSKEILNAKIQEQRDDYIKRNVLKSSFYFFDLIKKIQESLISEIKVIFSELSKERLFKNSDINGIKKNLFHFVEQFYSDALNLSYLIVSPNVIQEKKSESQKIVLNEIEILSHNLLMSVPENSSKLYAMKNHGGKSMEKNAIQQFIDTGILLNEEYKQEKKDLETSGIVDWSSDMPAGMHEWMNSIKIYSERHLTNHPLYKDINTVLFHNKNKIKDYDKMMGLLKAILQDISASEDSVAQNPKQPSNDTISQMSKPDNSNRKLKNYDVFISHATADKIDYVNELVDTIKKLGINVFYDSDTISWGDNWKDTILGGTEQSEFAIIVISESFFGREWTEKELSAFLHRQNNLKQKVILPLLHNITVEQLKTEYPSLEYIQSLSSAKYSMEQISLLLAKELIKRYKQLQ